MTSQVDITPDLVSEALGAFDELRVLGKGSFGTTFYAARGDDEYALKVIHALGIPEHLWRREIEALARIEHPNVVGFRRADNFTAAGQVFPFLECEFIAGDTMEQAIKTGQPIDSKDKLRELLTGLLAGLQEIHELGVIHRDIKPANIALRDGDWGKPVILDFGLAKVLDMSSHSNYPMHIGTKVYMAPEQLRGEPARTRSDMFAVGLVAYEAGTGKHPFLTPSTSSVQSLHDRMAAAPPEDPSTLRDIWADDVKGVVLRLLSYEGHRRLSVGRALQDLEGN